MVPANIKLQPSELQFSFIRSPGPGGQNVNKVATAVLLRFNVMHSPSLPEAVRLRLIALLGTKITTHGDLLIKATRYRTQERNKQDAIDRLQTVLKRAAKVPKKRKKTRPTLASKERRLTNKKLQGKTKALRRYKPKVEG
ncbi:MAG TPA: alternative ribosome rescue aminoacyl-tRNA hydrolase ArfB [Gammaproteobacteria bacterium]|nr:alternative ribosome rescue aminoacyl-tRNA hydrolase ArfB [Gammaproteobacteria bacterium]